MDTRDEIKAIVEMAEVLKGMDPTAFSRFLTLMERGVVALESLDKSVKLIQEVMNNPADNVPVGFSVQPQST